MTKGKFHLLFSEVVKTLHKAEINLVAYGKRALARGPTESTYPFLRKQSKRECKRNSKRKHSRLDFNN